ncbi:hypothetical protein M406DRAFT_333038 [Cryphonectria parasitica EP155]|uniref:Uncharacterized protein n=1 Tax=Cryphonectria parasitica (strain ATCC 38755 / EP155) TaxID=660469 RepID=A0A9P5CM32_CRYP1|nr:uncharacterized protein M406DRAFT_333038 [Cryphonectria parasitica EP155]KAF3762666.1 hypothetical protein M406DRAFT_333038 [Cryphonectria parasitica EP155]
MSSIIAVSVSLIGLSAVVFTLAIFVELIVSFPAMLTSNSQAYVQQQRKVYNISSSSGSQDAAVALELDQGDDEDADRWIDVADEEPGAHSRKTDVVTRGTRGGFSTTAWRREQTVTRGRTLRRGPRRHSARTGLRV